MTHEHESRGIIMRICQSWHCIWMAYLVETNAKSSLHCPCRPCGHRASVLYFVLQDLALADSMYQFSLDAYEDLFVDSISKANESNAMAASADEHVMALNADHTLAVYR